MTAGSAHWQLGRVEIHGSIIKQMLDKMDAERPIRTPGKFEASLTQAFNAKNSLSRIKGYSPEQAVLGIARRLPGSLTSDAGAGSLSLAEDEGPASDRFRQPLERRRKAFIDADNSSSLRRALLRRSRPLRGPSEVGDLLLYWRRKGANLKRERGRWFGPASVVAVEGNRNVWLNHSGKLIRASPEQIRPASFRERKQMKTPETSGNFPSSSFSQNLKDGGFIDLEEDGIPVKIMMIANINHQFWSNQLLSPMVRNQQNLKPRQNLRLQTATKLSVREKSQFPILTPNMLNYMRFLYLLIFLMFLVMMVGMQVCCLGVMLSLRFEEHSGDLWEIEIPLEKHQEASALCASSADESVLTVSDTKKRKVEVKLSTLKSEDHMRMAIAKHKEIGAWLKHSTVRKVAKGKIPEASIMRCRWILSWKSASPTDHIQIMC